MFKHFVVKPCIYAAFCFSIFPRTYFFTLNIQCAHEYFLMETLSLNAFRWQQRVKLLIYQLPHKGSNIQTHTDSLPALHTYYFSWACRWFVLGACVFLIQLALGFRSKVIAFDLLTLFGISSTLFYISHMISLNIKQFFLPFWQPKLIHY